jgi:hypothetical protein
MGSVRFGPIFIAMRRFLSRSAFAFAAAAVAGGAAAGAPAAKSAPLRITAPGRVFQGKVAVVSVKSQSFSCKLGVRYANGDQQTNMPPTQVVGGKVTWQWQVPEFAPAGQARLTVACPGAAKTTKPVIVVGGLIPPKIGVLKKGFSARIEGGGENVSYGLVLQNASPNGNALNVAVLINFVLPDNHLIGSASATIPIINAGSQYDLGGEISFGGAPTISRLEVAIDPGGRAKSAKNFSPGLDNVHLVPNPFDPQWLGSVEGDEVNIHPKLMLQSSNMSCVVFDGQGNVLGGGIGSGNFKLLPGTRSFFKISGGLDPIPYNKAASVSISIIPQYVQSASP